MSLGVFLAVLFSSLFQAGWNVLAKRSRGPKIALFAVGWFALGFAMLPFVCTATPPSEISSRGWELMLASGAIQAFYMCFLGWAYTHGDVSTVFPVARGIGVVCATVISVVLGLHDLSFLGMLGIGGVVGGAMLVGLSAGRPARGAVVFALLAGLTIGSYTVVDSLGAREVPVFFYLALMNVFAPSFAAPYLFWRMRGELREVLRSHKLEAMLVSLGGFVGYSIILWAYQRAPAAYVAALREISIALAAGLGFFLLRERLSRAKLIGVSLIVAGAVVIRFA